jgi:short-subunit dehydrogenase
VNLAGRGARLAISDVDVDGLEATAVRCEGKGGEVKVDRLDVTEREAVLAYAGEVQARFGKINQVYNNAGIAHYGEAERESFKDIERVLDVNFWGVVNGTKAFLPYLISSGDGHVINVSSLFGLIAFPGQSAYTASKFAVRGFTETLRLEMLVGGHPVHVTSVHPGGIKTAVARNATVADGLDPASVAEVFDKRMALHSPEMAAETIVEGVRKRRARIVVGGEAKALDRLSRITPIGAQRLNAWISRFLTVSPRSETAERR